MVPDLQGAWLVLLHCAAASAHFLLRVVSPDSVEQFAHNHDHQIWECLGQILDVDLNQCKTGMKASASLPLSKGGLGLRSAVRTLVPATGAVGQIVSRWCTLATWKLRCKWWYSWRVTHRLRVWELHRKPLGNWWGLWFRTSLMEGPSDSQTTHTKRG